MASIIRTKDKKLLVKKVDISLVKDESLTGKYKVLERLKVTNPEAYFYWALAIEAKHN